MTKISIKEVQAALKEHKFRSSLPEELKNDIRKYENNPSCPCNMSFYRKVLKYGAKQLQEFYPGKEIINVETLPVLQENNFTVINCHINELEPKLKLLGPGRKFITVGRFEDQVTVIVNELDFES
jgi:hypothetical protein